MALTFDEIKRIVFSFQKARDDTVQESTIEAAIYSAINQVLREAEYPGTQFEPTGIVTASGTYKYNIHDQVEKILDAVEITDSAGLIAPLYFKSWDDMRKLRHGTPPDNAKPTYWTVWGGKMELSPTPDAVYTVNYPSLKKGSTLDLIPETYRDAPMFGALSVFDPKYIGVFEKAKGEVLAYWEKMRSEQLSFRADGDVESHYNATEEINVI